MLLGLLTAMLVRQRTIALSRPKPRTTPAAKARSVFAPCSTRPPWGVAQVDSHRIIQRINQRYCDIIGYSPEELEGRSLREISHPDDQSLRGSRKWSDSRLGTLQSFVSRSGISTKRARSVGGPDGDTHVVAGQ